MYGHQELRMRRCAVCFYLEDGTLSVTEPKALNSGIVQGTFLKRHRVQNPATGGCAARHEARGGAHALGFAGVARAEGARHERHMHP